MVWQDIIVDRMLTDDEIISAISYLFSVPRADVLVIGDTAELLTKFRDNIQVICERQPTKGEFPMMLSIIPRSDETERFAKEGNDELLIGQFCGILSCKCLASDASIAPYSWLLIEGAGEARLVELNAERLDQDESEYIIDWAATSAGKVPQVA